METRREFIIQTGTGIVGAFFSPRFYERVLTHIDRHDEPLLDAPPQADPVSPKLAPWQRLAIVGAILLVLFLVGEAFGLRERFTVESLRDTVHGAGPWGYPVFIAVFSLAAHLPRFVRSFREVLAASAARRGERKTQPANAPPPAEMGSAGTES